MAWGNSNMAWWLGVDFINPFTLCAELLGLKKASQSVEHKMVWAQLLPFMKSTPAKWFGK